MMADDPRHEVDAEERTEQRTVLYHCDEKMRVYRTMTEDGYVTRYWRCRVCGFPDKTVDKLQEDEARESASAKSTADRSGSSKAARSGKDGRLNGLRGWRRH